MEYSEIILAGTALLLIAYLYVRHRRRVRAWANEREWPGHGIDTSRVAPRVQRLRQDYITEFPLRPHISSARKALLVSARRAVTQLSYFRRRDPNDYPTL